MKHSLDGISDLLCYPDALFTARLVPQNRIGSTPDPSIYSRPLHMRAQGRMLGIPHFARSFTEGPPFALPNQLGGSVGSEWSEQPHRSRVDTKVERFDRLWCPSHPRRFLENSIPRDVSPWYHRGF